MPSDSWNPPTDDAPAAGPLVDTLGRVANDLRVSVTDRCNFRCTYCMPAEGLVWLPKPEILTFEEITRLVGVFTSLGVRSLKLTGGEPTVRADLPVLVRMLRDVNPGVDMSLTTNGLLLERMSQTLADAGLDRVTVSCDSLMRHRFAEMTRRDALERVLAGLEAAEAAGLTPIKLNVVVIGGTNDDEAVEFARFARRTGYEVRFIEYMPLDADRAWERAKVVPSARLLQQIDAEHSLTPDHGPEPATTYRFADGAPGAVGVIPSVTEPFCDTCNRLRLTADGQFRSCLFALEEADLRGPLRAGASDEELAVLIREGVWRKWPGHRINHPDFVQPERSMSMIGG
jgi:cyclic pyranopterin phosphate synthase